ncbi:MAG: DNA-formamidopyrimidine glycosylase [Candidatus Omnitrophota bacterium]
MPELPEVETIRRDLDKIIVGKKILRVCVRNPRVIREPGVERFKDGLKGAVIRRVLRRGKVLILELSNAKSLVIHLKMTGQLVYPGDAKKSRVSFCLSDGKIMDFNDQRLFAELRLLDDWRSLRFIRNLGPEPFELTPAEFSNKLNSRRTSIKPLLMEQDFISGIGNLYAAEVLFCSGIDPRRPAQGLSNKEKNILFRQIKKVLREAIRYGGSSVDNYVRLSGGRGDYVRHHKVYGRKGKPCFVCKTPIERIVLGSRGTYFCPKCQR